MTRALLASLLLLGVAAAQEPERPSNCIVYDEGEFLTKLPPNTPAGTAVSIVYVKFRNLTFNGEVKLHQSQIPEQRLVVKDPALVQRLNKGEDSDGARLLTRRSNIQLIGVTRTLPDGAIQLEVSRVKLLESDEQMFRRKLASLGADDWNGRLVLAHEVRQRGQMVEDEEERAGLSKLVRQLGDDARKLEQAQLEPLPAGAEAWLRFGRRYKEVDVLAQVHAHAGVPEPMRRQAEQLLKAQNARTFLGRWYSYEAYKARLGMVQIQAGGEARWVTADRAAFLKAIEAEKQIVLPDFGSLTEEQLQEATRQGKVIRGMKKHHVLQISKGGETPWLPVKVDRVREHLEKGPVKGTIVWEQWVMPEGTRIYFYNSFVISKEG